MDISCNKILNFSKILRFNGEMQSNAYANLKINERFQFE